MRPRGWKPEYVFLQLDEAASTLSLPPEVVVQIPGVQTLTRSWPDGRSENTVRLPVSFLEAGAELPAPRAETASVSTPPRASFRGVRRGGK